MGNTTLYPTADTYVACRTENGVCTEYGNKNFGSEAHIDSTRRVIARRILLKFNISSLPTGAVITLAKIRLYCYMLAASATHQFHSVTDDTWTELGVTWNNQPDHITLLDSKVVNAIDAWYEWTVTDFVKSQFEAGDNIVSFKSICLPENAGFVGAFFRSKEFDGLDPELYIEYTVGVAHKKTVSEILGLVDSKTFKHGAGHKLTVSEVLGLADAVKMIYCDAECPNRGKRVTVLIF